MKTNIKSLVLVLTGSIYGVMLFVSSICSAVSYPTSTATPLATDLSMNQYKLTDVGDVIAKGPWADVRAFGAVGDGVTDDTTAIQAAINNVLGGGIVLFPKGTYRTNSSLSIPITARDVTLQGYGAMIDSYVNDSILKISDITTPNNRAENITVAGLSINGRGMTNTNYPNQNGIEVGAILNARFENIRITNMPNIGFKGLKSPQSGSAYWNQVLFNRVFIQGTGFQAVSIGETGAACDDITIISSLFNTVGKLKGASNSGEAGVYISVHTIHIAFAEISNVRNDDGLTGYVTAMLLRRASGQVSAAHFENNGNNHANSVDLILDTDPSGIVITGITHSASQSTAARTGIRVRSSGVVINGVKHDGTLNHVLTDVVDIQGVQNVFVAGVTDSTGGTPPANAYILTDSFTTGAWINQGKVYFSSSSGISKHLSTTSTWDPPSIGNGGAAATTVTVSGAALGDTVVATFNQIGTYNMLITGHVQATDTVRVVLNNHNGGSVNLASGTVRVDVWKH